MVVSRPILRLSSNECQFKSFKRFVTVPGSHTSQFFTNLACFALRYKSCFFRIALYMDGVSHGTGQRPEIFLGGTYCSTPLRIVDLNFIQRSSNSEADSHSMCRSTSSLCEVLSLRISSFEEKYLPRFLIRRLYF